MMEVIHPKKLSFYTLPMEGGREGGLRAHGVALIFFLRIPFWARWCRAA